MSDETQSPFECVPREMKMPCGCYGDFRQGNTQATWLITAEAFLCPMRHKQGDVIVAVDLAGEAGADQRVPNAPEVAREALRLDGGQE